MDKANQTSIDELHAIYEPPCQLPPEQSKQSKSTNPEYKRTTIYLRKVLHRKLKASAAAQEREMSEIIEEMVENYLKFRYHSTSLD